jgi:hypothetical protein
MTKLAVLRTAFIGTSWKCQFAEQLTRLRPDLNPDAADEISDAMHRDHADLTPAEAANRWMTSQTGAAGAGSTESEAEVSAALPGPSACAGSDRRL